jgi:ferredoxin-thioredoxin reductase catalytic chain
MSTGQEQVGGEYLVLKREAESGGYHLNPDVAFAKDLVQGLLTNRERYGYPSCPCRLAAGERAEDLDIICPCDYRDPDLEEYGSCYCGLYVSTPVVKGEKTIGSIPERRPHPEQRAAGATVAGPTSGVVAKDGVNPFGLSQPVWRCRVCGYLCARGGPPEICPICKVTRDRFERFI